MDRQEEDGDRTPLLNGQVASPQQAAIQVDATSPFPTLSCVYGSATHGNAMALNPIHCCHGTRGSNTTGTTTAHIDHEEQHRHSHGSHTSGSTGGGGGGGWLATWQSMDVHQRKLVVATAVCFIFMLAEVVGGVLAGSLAILSDAAHLLSDIAGFLISLVSMFIAKRPATKRLSFGFHRAEILGALLSVSFIWTLTFYLVMEAIDRVRHPQPIDGRVMFIVACMGLVVNVIMATTLHDHGHGHGHSHGHDHSHDNINVRAALLHVIGDFIQSIGVLIAAVLIWTNPDWVIADPICTFFFSILVLITTSMLVKEAVLVLMEGTPPSIDPHDVMRDLTQVPGVERVHDMHIWSIASGKTALAVHILIHRKREQHQTTMPQATSPTEDGVVATTTSEEVTFADYNRILAACQTIACHKYDIPHSTIQIEPLGHSHDPLHCCALHCDEGACCEGEGRAGVDSDGTGPGMLMMSSPETEIRNDTPWLIDTASSPSDASNAEEAKL